MILENLLDEWGTEIVWIDVQNIHTICTELFSTMVKLFWKRSKYEYRNFVLTFCWWLHSKRRFFRWRIWHSPKQRIWSPILRPESISRTRTIYPRTYPCRNPTLAHNQDTTQNLALVQNILQVALEEGLVYTSWFSSNQNWYEDLMFICFYTEEPLHFTRPEGAS